MIELSNIAPRRPPEATPPIATDGAPARRHTAQRDGFADIFAALRDDARPASDTRWPDRAGAPHAQDASTATAAQADAPASDTERMEDGETHTTPQADAAPDDPVAAPVSADAPHQLAPPGDAAAAAQPDETIPSQLVTQGLPAGRTPPRTTTAAGDSAGPAPDQAMASTLATAGMPRGTGTAAGTAAARSPGDGPDMPAIPASGGQTAPADGRVSTRPLDSATPTDMPPTEVDGEAVSAPAAHGTTPRDTGTGAATGPRPAETAAIAATSDPVRDGGSDTGAPGPAPGQAATVPNTAQAPGPVSPAPSPAMAQPLADPTGRPMPAPFLLQTEAADWMNRLVERIGSGVPAGIDEIELTLTPRNLGSLTVRIDLRDTAASVAIVTETPEAARLFNDQQGKLAELLGQSGLSLGDHRAGTGSGPGLGGQGPGRETTRGAAAAAEAPADGADMRAVAPRRAGLVDLLA
ncbi:flagellar hook-length control protein FliK [Meridianimarinicoccus sp. RP-17]|uniref:flagellar hook-length control protein FliK n=1 Tax=Meridianimarinicoccus zhengii TaxID=2056810 RepID=UPI000DAB4105|nr:flagellar hook-length control protein FliK [Phycocomes zhengii]